MADAGLSPHAVVIQLIDAASTRTAVGVPRALPVIALIAPFAVVEIVRFGVLLLQLFHVVADAHGLEVAPQTHEHVEVDQCTH